MNVLIVVIQLLGSNLVDILKGAAVQVCPRASTTNGILFPHHDPFERLRCQFQVEAHWVVSAPRNHASPHFHVLVMLHPSFSFSFGDVELLES